MERPCFAVVANLFASNTTGIRAEEWVRNFADRDMQARTHGERRCYECVAPNLVCSCPKKDRGVRKVKCWTCVGLGHMSRVCLSGQGACAPEAPQGVE